MADLSIQPAQRFQTRAGGVIRAFQIEGFRQLVMSAKSLTRRAILFVKSFNGRSFDSTGAAFPDTRGWRDTGLSDRRIKSLGHVGKITYTPRDIVCKIVQWPIFRFNRRSVSRHARVA